MSGFSTHTSPSFKRMHIDRERLLRLCESLHEELNKDGGEAVKPLYELGKEWCTAHETILKPLVETHSEQQGMGFIMAYTKRELLNCLKKAVATLIQQCSKQAGQTRKKLREVLSARSFPRAVDAENIALELAQKLKAAFLSKFLTDDSLYKIVLQWLELYLINKRQTLPKSLKFFDPHMTYAEIFRIEAATDVAAGETEKESLGTQESPGAQEIEGEE